jgi:ABC-type transport system involved in multi-copper enzyme maturation permease subunit
VTVGLMVGRLLRRGLAGTLALLAGIAIFQFLNPLIADSLGGAGGVQSLIETLPASLRAVARIQPELIGFSGLAGYLSLGFTHPLYLVLLSSTTVGFTGRSLAGEIDRGTIALALARPISRRRAYLARVVGLVVLCLALGVVGSAGIWLGVIVSRPAGDFEPMHLLALSGVAILLSWAIGGLTLWCSAASSTTGRVVAWATAVLVIFYFVDYFAELWSVLEPIAPVSLLAYFDPGHALVNGQVRPLDAAVLTLAGLGGVIIGAVVFERRDLTI